MTMHSTVQEVRKLLENKGKLTNLFGRFLNFLADFQRSFQNLQGNCNENFYTKLGTQYRNADVVYTSNTVLCIMHSVIIFQFLFVFVFVFVIGDICQWKKHINYLPMSSLILIFNLMFEICDQTILS